MSPPAGAVLDKQAVASFLLLLNLILVVGVAEAAGANTMGVNYGRLGDNLPPPARVVQLLKNNKIGSAKIFDHDPTVIAAFANSGIRLVIGVTNQEVVGIGQSSATATQWVQQNVVPYYPATQISAIAVGNELLTYSNPENVPISQQLCPALLNLHSALKAAGLHRNIHISSPIAYDALNSSYPPTTGSFRADVAETIIRPLLRFLRETGSPFMINLYPYFAYAGNPNISLEYATFGVSAVPVSDGAYHYTNLLDAQLDALHFAMARLGHGNVSIWLTETGWPTKGDADQRGTSIPNAAKYNRRLVRRVMSGVGTPAKLGVFLPTYIFGLFNENQKPGPTTERNWGLLYPDGAPVYQIDLIGQLADSDYPPLGGDTAPPPHSSAPPAHSSAPPAHSSAPPPHSSAPPQPFPPPHNSAPVPSVPALPPPPAVPSTVAPPPLLTPPGVVTAPPPHAVTLQWCTCNPSASVEAIQAALDYACSKGHANCVPIQAGQPCFDPNTLDNHAAWALNSYWQQSKASGGTCDFAGAAMLTAVDPSVGGCIYPSK